MRGRWCGGRRVERTKRNHLWLAFEREGGGGGGSQVETAEMNHLRLVFGREGGGGGGSQVKTPKKTTFGLRLDAREVVVVGVGLKQREKPPLAHVWMQGRWWWWELHRNYDSNHLRLAFGCKGGDGGGQPGCNRH